LLTAGRVLGAIGGGALFTVIWPIVLAMLGAEPWLTDDTKTSEWNANCLGTHPAEVVVSHADAKLAPRALGARRLRR
jgi:hypothetical protein